MRQCSSSFWKLVVADLEKEKWTSSESFEKLELFILKTVKDFISFVIELVEMNHCKSINISRLHFLFDWFRDTQIHLGLIYIFYANFTRKIHSDNIKCDGREKFLRFPIKQFIIEWNLLTNKQNFRITFFLHVTILIVEPSIFRHNHLFMYVLV